MLWLKHKCINTIRFFKSLKLCILYKAEFLCVVLLKLCISTQVILIFVFLVPARRKGANFVGILPLLITMSWNILKR